MPDAPLTYEQIYRNLDGMIALATAQRTDLKVRKGERHTEFVKRIVATYVHTVQEAGALPE